MADTIIIKPKPSWKFIDIAEVWRFRELLYVFTWRNIKVRYKQTALGILWAIFQPLASTLIFTVFFGHLARIPSGKLPYALFVLIGLVFWTFFSNSLSQASTSMVVNSGIIQKVYFPKIILPFSTILTTSVDFILNVVLLFVIAIIMGYIPSLWGILIFPVAIFITSTTAAGLGLFLSSINVKYRDVGYILPFFIQLLVFLTPVIYPTAILSERNKVLMALNPMTSVIESSRAVFAHTPFNPLFLTISFFSSIIIFLFGIWYFERTERFFADIV